MLPRRMLIATLAAAAVVASACTSDDEKPEGPLPDAAELVEDASKAAAEIESTHFLLSVDGKVPGLSVNSIDGDLTSEGDKVAAKGTAKLGSEGQSIQLTFTLHEGTLYLEGMPGGTQEIPEEQAAMVYDFSAVLDPDRGIAKLIGSLTDAETVEATTVLNQPAYKIEGTVPKDALTGLVPRATEDVEATLWVGEEDRKPIKAAARFPGEGGEAGTMTVTLSKINQSVSIEPPSE